MVSLHVSYFTLHSYLGYSSQLPRRPYSQVTYLTDFPSMKFTDKALCVSAYVHVHIHVYTSV